MTEHIDPVFALVTSTVLWASWFIIRRCEIVAARKAARGVQR